MNCFRADSCPLRRRNGEIDRRTGRCPHMLSEHSAFLHVITCKCIYLQMTTYRRALPCRQKNIFYYDHDLVALSSMIGRHTPLSAVGTVHQCRQRSGPGGMGEGGILFFSRLERHPLFQSKDCGRFLFGLISSVFRSPSISVPLARLHDRCAS